MFSVRNIHPRDVASFMDAASAYFSEAEKWTGIGFDLERIQGFVERGMLDDKQFIQVAVNEMTGQVCGFMWGCAVAQIHTDQMIAYDSYLYVLPDFRGKHLAPKLVDNFTKWARNLGCYAVLTGANSQIDGAADKLYLSKGFAHIGNNYMKEL